MLDKERLPRWGWLTVGLVAAAFASNVLNVALVTLGVLSPEYGAVTVIASMAPVMIYVGVWYDEERQHYWHHDRLRVVADVAFVVLGAVAGSTAALLAIGGSVGGFLAELLAMAAGFVAAWVLFYVRNPDLYELDTDANGG
ncbi:hypothetical protein [Halovivax limisalsi]|uniref:hypothetical protein n=1 Tax=Halovivax limisalsi TaxID=1453760 RepID=UPI001FFD2213|nr:hypothetical protein [Halovivax limisalsi]